MSREKQGFRDTMAQLNELYPDRVMLNKDEAARAIGVHRNTLERWIKAGKFKFNDALGRISKADLARQICN